jgi:hypothetical protein
VFRTVLRLRLPELLTERELSAYEFARRASARGHTVSARTVQRLAAERGHAAQFRGALLLALTDVLGLTLNDLFVSEMPRRGKASR